MNQSTMVQLISGLIEPINVKKKILKLTSSESLVAL